MGLIAGIYSKERDESFKAKLMDMISCQAHRDKSTPVTVSSGSIVMGMANKHNNIFTNSQASHAPYSVQSDERGEVSVLVDGIVLDIPNHKLFFENNGFPIPAPTCTAIVSAAYEMWGLEFMNHLDGDFACAIWDQKHQSLILARDPYGHKPLHYYHDKSRIVFSSEIKGILKSGIDIEIDLMSLSDFLSLNCIPYPQTIFKNIMQVEPGAMLICNQDGIRTKQYWHPVINTDESISLDKFAAELSHSVKDSVRKRIVSNNVFCFLSGGIDSSAIVSFASELTDKPVQAISVGFAEEDRNELEFSSLMARHVGAEHHQVIAKPDSFFNMLDKIVSHHDSPFTDTSSYPTFYAAECAHSLTDIILTGDGPDQIMGGSAHYVFAAKNNLFSQRNSLAQSVFKLGSSCLGLITGDPVPSKLARMQRRLYRDSLSPIHGAYDLRSYFPDIVKRFICTDDFWDVHVQNNPYRHPESWFARVAHTDDINKYLYADMRFYLPDDLMIKVDRMCMAHGLETLSPFLDRSVSDVAGRIPGKYKIHNASSGDAVTKYILKKVCQDRLPQVLLSKKKRGFGIPVDKWLKQDQGKYIKDILLDNRTMNRGYFKKDSLTKMVNAFIGNRGDYFFPNPHGIVGLLTLELCQRRYLD